MGGAVVIVLLTGVVFIVEGKLYIAAVFVMVAFFAVGAMGAF